jgi:hypothetical protein
MEICDGAEQRHSGRRDLRALIQDHVARQIWNAAATAHPALRARCRSGAAARTDDLAVFHA